MDSTLIGIYLGVALIGLTAALVGVFAYLRKQALLGDALSHALLPGVVIAYILSQSRNTLVLFLGALIAGWLATGAINTIIRSSKLKQDTAIAVVLSTFFGLGLVLLSWLQGNGNASQAGLSDFLFGKIAAISRQDLIQFVCISILLVGTILWRFRIFYYMAFDAEYLSVRGFSVSKNDQLIATFSILAIAMGIQAVGVVLMSALLIIPVVVARQWSYRIRIIVLIAVLIGCFGAILGAYLSSKAPNIPTGPVIIMVLFTSLMVTLIIRAIRITLKERPHG